MPDETKVIAPIMGPYRGNRLVVSTADGDAAINDHWAVDPLAPPADPPHDPLTEEERTAAMTAANTWAQAQWEHAGNPPPPETPLSSRAMGAGPAGGYTTRGKK